MHAHAHLLTSYNGEFSVLIFRFATHIILIALTRCCATIKCSAYLPVLTHMCSQLLFFLFTCNALHHSSLPDANIPIQLFVLFQTLLKTTKVCLHRKHCAFIQSYLIYFFFVCFYSRTSFERFIKTHSCLFAVTVREFILSFLHDRQWWKMQFEVMISSSIIAGA